MRKILLSILSLTMISFLNLSATVETKTTVNKKLPLGGGWNYTMPDLSGAVSVYFTEQWGTFNLAKNTFARATYPSAIINFSSAVKGSFMVQTGKPASEGGSQYGDDTFDIAEGLTSFTVTFPTSYTNVNQFSIKNKSGATATTHLSDTLNIASVYLVGADNSQTQSTYTAGWGSTALVYSAAITFTSQWGQVGVTSWAQSLQTSETGHFELTLDEPAPADFQWKINDGVEKYPAITAGETKISTPEYNTSITEASLQYKGTTIDGTANVLKVKSVEWVKTITNGISNLSSDKKVISTQYYSVSGSQLSAPVKGLNIVKKTMSDGSVVSSKVMSR
jgi:hypothetical protein